MFAGTIVTVIAALIMGSCIYAGTTKFSKDEELQEMGIAF